MIIGGRGTKGEGFLNHVNSIIDSPNSVSVDFNRRRKG
jgi:hypothetical protein